MKHFFSRIVFFVALAITAISGQGHALAGGFTLTSTAFKDGGVLPAKQLGYTGAGRSPQLSWSGASAKAKSFVIICYDETANFSHWGIYNISPATRSLPENAGALGATKFGKMVSNDFAEIAFGGATPPPGLKHTYQFTIYALNTTLVLKESKTFPATTATLLRAMMGRVIGSANLTATYTKK